MDALLHRYGGNLSFLDNWTWNEAVSFIGSVMERITDEERRLRWYIRYEETFRIYRLPECRHPVPCPDPDAREVYADAKKTYGSEVEGGACRWRVELRFSVCSARF